MGNYCVCFDRFGKRRPDGPLLSLPGKSKQGTLLASMSTASTVSGGSSDVGKTPSSSSNTSTNTSIAGGGGGAGADAARASRRRPTYSASRRKSEAEVSSFDEIDDDESSSEEDKALSASDVRLNKIADYRKRLTKLVKLKTNFFAETVKVTISKDGQSIEWYKGKNKSDETQQGKKKPAGSFSIDKISAVKTRVDNPRGLDLTVGKGTSFENFAFSFKKESDRQEWQNELESLQKFISLK